MTDEKVHHVCCVCGKVLPQMTGYELVQKACGMDMGNGQILYFCHVHTAEEVVLSYQRIPKFKRASEVY